MEFTHGRREIRFYSDPEEEQEESSSKNPTPFIIPSSSTSSSSTSSSPTALRWSSSTDGGPPDGGGGGGGGSVASVEKEHLFDKVVTPSDVGKLNRLVIPKQHAEKYFPLDAAANEKGLLLSFEDRTGKPWRFRYSYWNSSQSYVMTKGWSRFVKEKRLDAGDTVSFGRGVGDAARERLFIDWRRRPEAAPAQDPPRLPRIPIPVTVPFPRSAGPWAGRLFIPPVYDQHQRPGYGYINSIGSSGGGAGGGVGGGRFLFFRSAVPHTGIVQGAGAVSSCNGDGDDGSGAVTGVPMVLDSVPLVHGQAAAKRVRLFGVNLDCPESDRDAIDGRNIITAPMPHFQPRSALPLLQLPRGLVESSAASSSSSPPPKEQHSPLDLDM